MKPAIEIMKISHTSQICEIERASFATPWPAAFFIEELENPYSINLVAIIDGNVAGYMCCRHIVNEGHIGNIAVAPNYRRQGIAEALMLHLDSISKERELIGLTLEVASGNIAAQELYKKHGFISEGLRKNYYSDIKQDAIIMWKYFKNYEAEVAP